MRPNRISLIVIVSAFLLAGSAALADAPASGGTPSSGQSSAPASPTASALPGVKSSSLPDYGGRDSVGSAVAASSGASALSPLGQAWRALEALTIVLALIVGGLFLLKRSGLVKTNDASPLSPLKPQFLSFFSLLRRGRRSQPTAPNPAAAATGVLKVLGTQPLPNAPGTCLHLVSLAGKTLLIGTTPQAISVLSELDAEGELETGEERRIEFSAPPSGFEAYLTRAEESSSQGPSETELLMRATTMRLQALMAHSQNKTSSRPA